MVVVENEAVSIVINFVTSDIDSVSCKLAPRGHRQCEFNIMHIIVRRHICTRYKVKCLAYN